MRATSSLFSTCQYLGLGCLSLMTLAACQTSSSTASSTWKPLLDNELSQWEVWMGVPHSSVKGLPAGTYQADNLNVHGDASNAMGLNNDVKNVFTVIEENGEPVLHITGEVYGGLTTLAEYSNYHLKMEVKWGDKKWAPRLTNKRDSGLLYHCQGEHGAFWKVWKACQELQIQETDFGDYIPLAGPSGTIKTNDEEPEFKYNPQGKNQQLIKGYSHASNEPDLAHGEWNKVELYAFDDVGVFVINGEAVMVVEDSKDAAGNALTSGQLQLQSEGAELFYRRIQIKSIDALPDALVAAK